MNFLPPAVFLLFPAVTYQLDDIVSASYVTKSVADWFDVTCILLLRSGNLTVGQSHQLFRIMKIMFEDNEKTVSVKKFRAENVGYRYYRERCSQMLYVIHGRQDEVRHELEQISHAVKMGGPTWIIFLPNTTSPEQYLENSSLTYNANFIIATTRGSVVSLTHAYRVSMNHPIRLTQFGEWSFSEGLVVHEDYTPYWRRDNMEGQIFKVSAIDSWPVAIFYKDVIGGYFGKVWKDLEGRLNFSTVYVEPRDFSTGVRNGEKWNGLMGMILDNEIDVAISEVIMTTDRLHVVDFLKPLYATRYQLFFKPPGLMIQWDLILKPFRMEVWLGLLIYISALTLLLIGGYRLGLRYGLEDPRYHMEYGSYQCFFLVVSAFASQGNVILPKSISCRLTLATVYLSSLIVVIIYSCMLTSMIAIQKPFRPFNSLESFLRDGSYTLEQIPGSDGYAYFSSTNEPILGKIYRNQFSKLPPEELPKSRKMAMRRVCENNRIAHLGEFGLTVLPALHYMESQGCTILYLERPLRLLYLTMAITKDSPYRDAIDHQLAGMMTTGILNRFRMRNFPLWRRPPSISFQSVPPEQVAQMNVLLVIGMLLAFSVFFCELFTSKCFTGKTSESHAHESADSIRVLVPRFVSCRRKKRKI